jgi:hypothetical protein
LPRTCSTSAWRLTGGSWAENFFHSGSFSSLHERVVMHGRIALADAHGQQGIGRGRHHFLDGGVAR